MSGGRKSRAWWQALSPDKRAEMRRRQGRVAVPLHHYQDDTACPACGTDSTVGCVEGVGRG